MSKIGKNHYSSVLIWLIMSLFFMYQFVARSTFPTVLTEEYMKFFSLDAKGVGALVGCYYFLYTFAQIPSGIVLDKFSVRSIATLSVLACAFGVMLFIATNNYYLSCFGQMLLGLGAAPAFISTVKVIVTYFQEKDRPVFMSYAQSFGCMGPVIFGPLVAQIVKTFNWRSVMFVFSLLGLALAFIIWRMLGDDTMQKAKTKQESTVKPVSLRKSLKLAFMSPQLWIIALFSMMQYVPLCALADLWGTSFLKKLYNADTAVCSIANNMIYVGLVCGNPFFAYLAVKMNSYKKAMCIAIFSCFTTFSVILFVDNIPLYAMFTLFFIMGFTSGAMLGFALGTAMFKETMAATISGFINMVCMLSGVILMPLIGYLIDLSWNGVIQNGVKFYRIEDFRFGFRSVLIALFLGFLLSLMMKNTPVTEKSQPK